MPDDAVTAVPSIRMGEMATITSGRLRSLLGSCVGVAVYDRASNVGGLAHIVLPQSRHESENPGKYVDTAIPLLLSQIAELVGSSSRLHAKIAGGANMFDTQSVATIGQQNIDSIELCLAKHRIPILARHCGGNQGRRMTLDTSTGSVSIDMAGAETILI